MEKIIFDSGVKEYDINGNGVLRFNPSDPNVYARFFDAAEQIKEIEKDLTKKAQSLEEKENDGEMLVRFVQDADKQVKGLLNRVFGGENDFEKLLGGVNLLAVATNGERVVTNLLAALMPIIEQGAKRCADEKVNDAVKKAKSRRAQSGAAK